MYTLTFDRQQITTIYMVLKARSEAYHHEIAAMPSGKEKADLEEAAVKVFEALALIEPLFQPRGVFYSPEQEQQLLDDARRGDATAAAELWTAIAHRRVDDAITVAWARDVAFQVIAKILNTERPANRRRESARAVLGLEGRVDKNYELRQFAERNPDLSPAKVAEYADLCIDVEGKSPTQMRKAVEHMRRSGGK